MSGTLWFASAYIALMLVSPLLNEILKIDRLKLRTGILVGFFLICIETMIRPEIDDWLSWLLWFPYLYICTGYYKRYVYNQNRAVKSKRTCINDKNRTANIMVIAVILLYLMFCAGIAYCKIYDKFPTIKNLIVRYTHEIYVGPNIFIAVVVWLYFLHMKNWIPERVGGY